MRVKINRFALLLPMIFIAGGSDSVSSPDEKQRSYGTDDGLEARHSQHHGPECPFPYVDVNDMCLYAFCSTSLGSSQTFMQAMATCMAYGLGGNLAIYNSGNEYNNILSYLKQIDPSNLCNYWVGGTNLNPYGVWKWYTWALVPQGIPFWGTPQPTLSGNSNYTILATGGYYWGTVSVDDNASQVSSLGKSMPLCQFQRKKKQHHHKNSHHLPSSGFVLPSYSFLPYFPYPQHHHHLPQHHPHH